MRSTKPTPHAPQSFHANLVEAIRHRVLAVRGLIPTREANRPQRGDAVERATRELFRRLLPRRFGVGFGLISWGHGPVEGSSPLDLIVYDDLNYGPTYSEGDFVVVPPVAVLAIVEVKSDLGGQFTKAKSQIVKAYEQVGELSPGSGTADRPEVGASSSAWTTRRVRAAEARTRTYGRGRRRRSRDR